MDEETKNIVLRYINSNYKLTHECINNFHAINIQTSSLVKIISVYEEISMVFGLPRSDISSCFNIWIDEEATRIDNEIIDNMYKNYETGYPIEYKKQVGGDISTILKLSTIHTYNYNKFLED